MAETYIANKPLVKGNIKLRNRLAFAAIDTQTGDLNGKVTDRTLDFYREKSKGFGLVVIEHAYVAPEGKVSPHQLSICEEADIPSMRRLTDLLHENECSCQLQIDHSGGWELQKLRGLLEAQKTDPTLQGPAMAYSVDEIHQLVDQYAQAAVRAKEAGFDGVQIKMCHIYLISQFYSPLTNKRTDEYNGQTLEGRLKFALETTRAVRAAVGPDYPVSCRFSCDDFTPGGSTMEDFVKSAPQLVEAGIDMIDISGGPKYRFSKPGDETPGWFAEHGKAVKKVVDVPIMIAGGLTTPEHAEQLIQSGAADIAGVCRPVCKNENWATEALFYYSAMDFPV